MIVLHMLGRCVIQTDIATITPRAKALFALGLRLIMARGRPLPRQALMELYWSNESDFAPARRRFRKNLSELKQRGFDIQGEGTPNVWLPRERVMLDVDVLHRETPEALMLRDLTVLPGYSGRMSHEFEQYIDEVRATIRHDIVAALVDVAERAKTSAEWEDVYRVTGRAVLLDPLHERANMLHTRADRILTTRKPVPDSAVRSYALFTADGRYTARESPSGDAGESNIAAQTFPAARDTMLMGRTQDLAVLTAAFGRAIAEQGNAVYLYGEAGIGKSRLTRELSAIAATDGAIVIRTDCQPHHVHQPLSVLLGIVPELRRMAQRLQLEVTGDEFLDRITQHTIGVTEASPEAKETDYIRERVRNAVFGLLDTISCKAPLVMIVESLQWCSSASWSLLYELAKRAHELGRDQLFVLTSRDEWPKEVSADVPSSPPKWVAVHQMKPLAYTASAQHVEAYAAALGCTLSSEFRTWCAEVSEGNPYFTEELVNHWRTTGTLFEAPPSLATLIEARVSGLSEQALHLLQGCAVLGEQCTLPRLVEMFHLPYPQLLPALEELGRVGMLRTEDEIEQSDGNTVRCRHDVLATCATDKLTPLGLRLLHHRAGTILDRELQESSSATLQWACAEHWDKSGNATRAVELGLSCARHVWETGAVPHAVAAYKRTLHYCRTKPQQIKAMKLLTEVLYHTKNWDDFFTTTTELRRLKVDQGKPSDEHDDDEIRELNATWHSQSHWDGALQRGLSCVRSPHADVAHRLKAGIVLLKIGTNKCDDDLMHKVYHTLAPVLYEEGIEPSDRLSFDLIYHAICGEPGRCSNIARELLKIERNKNNGVSLIRPMLNCAGGLYRAGEIRESLQLYAEVYDLAIQLEAHHYASYTAQWALELCQNVDDLEAAKTWEKRLISLECFTKGTRTYFHQRTTRARFAIANGDFLLANELLGEGHEAPWNDPIDTLRAYSIAAKIRLCIANRECKEVVRNFTDRLKELHHPHCHMGKYDYEAFSLYLGLTYIDQIEEAQDILRRYIKHFRRDVYPPTLEIQCALRCSESLADPS